MKYDQKSLNGDWPEAEKVKLKTKNVESCLQTNLNRQPVKQKLVNKKLNEKKFFLQ